MKPTKQHIALALVIVAVTLAGCAAPGKKSGSSRADAKSQSAKLDRDTKSNFDRAVSMMKANRHADAIPLLEAVTQAEPELASAYANLGIAYLQTSRLNDSERAFEKATTLGPKTAAYWNYLGIARRQQGKFNDARDAYQKALQTDPEFSDAHLNMGILLDLYLKNPTEALTHYQAYQAQSDPKDKVVEKWIVELERRTKASTGKGKGTTP